MPRATRSKIRILFINCPQLDAQACRYLILAQNNVQNVLQFAVYPFWSCAETYVEDGKTKLSFLARVLKWWSEKPLPFSPWAYRQYLACLDRLLAPIFSSPLRTNVWEEPVRIALEKYDQFLEYLPEDEGGWSIDSAPTIIVTETPFEDYNYCASDDDVSILSIAGWDRYFAPPSVLEFILHEIQAIALELAYDPEHFPHYPIRGCINDYAEVIEEARHKIMTGYFCDACERALGKKISKRKLETIKSLVSNNWIGRVEEPGSVASNLKRVFGYDLTRTRGLRSSWRDRVLDVATIEAVKWFVVFALGMLAAMLFQTEFIKGFLPN